MDKKKQLGNVAFGGNWSEEILILDELRSILGVIDKAIDDCMDRDVEDEDLHQAMQERGKRANAVRGVFQGPKD